MVASLVDPYLTAEEYRARIGKTDNAEDATVITPVLLAISRFFEKECGGRFFNMDAAAVVRTYDGNGETLLYVDDIATATGLVVKVDLDGDYAFTGTDETLTINTHFWLGPPNVLLEPEPQPYRYLQIRPDNSVLSIWPEQLRSVQVTAKFGWPAVPAILRDATALVAREMLDLQKAGPTAMMQNVEDVVRLSPTAFAIVQRIKREYGKVSLFA